MVENGDGSGSWRGTVFHQLAAVPVPASTVVAAANGNAIDRSVKEGLGVEKVKFTVFVRGHQWSSARLVNETLEEFASAIERNARRLAFIEEDDSIQRLQLTYCDGSEPEDLDVDSTMGDVIICMRDKQLVAIVNSTSVVAPPPGASDGTTITPSMNANSKKMKRVSSSCGDPNTPSRVQKFPYPSDKTPARSVAVATDPSRTWKLNFPPDRTSDQASGSSSLPFLAVDRSFSFHTCCAAAGESIPPLLRRNGKVTEGGPGKLGIDPSTMLQQQFWNNQQSPSPSSAELANMPVRSASNPPRVGGMAVNARSFPTGGFQSFASALLNRLPMMPNQDILCSRGGTTNVAILAQVLASQLRAFEPRDHSTYRDNKMLGHACDFPTAAAAAAATPSSIRNSHLKDIHCSDHAMTENNYGAPILPCDTAANSNAEKLSPASAAASLEKSKAKSSSSSSFYSSANVQPSLIPPSCDGNGVDSEHPSGGSELVFLVNRRSKTGVGKHHLKMSDLSGYFHLSVVNAAKKLGVSQTTLKKACRKFGLRRWPGRKVRSLESTIHGLKHTIAVGQVSGLEELSEAYMRSEVCKLQQEMDQLVHGTPAQVTQKMQSPAVRTADLYKRLYSRGWRSKYHSAGRLDVHALETGNHTTGASSGLPPPTARKYKKVTKENQQRRGPLKQQQQQRQQQQEQVPLSGEPAVAVTPTTQPSPKSSNDDSRLSSRGTVVKDCDIEGLLQEVHLEVNSEEVNEALVEEIDYKNPVKNLDRNGTPMTVDECEKADMVEMVEQRPAKRPKRECRIPAAVGQD